MKAAFAVNFVIAGFLLTSFCAFAQTTNNVDALRVDDQLRPPGQSAVTSRDQLAAMIRKKMQSEIGRGGVDTGGGSVFEAYESEFKLIAVDLVRELELSGLSSDQTGFELKKFHVALSKVIIFATNKKLEFDGETRDALNALGQKIIVFNANVWSSLLPRQKRLLVLHEYMRFLDLDDSNYDYSIPLMRRLEAKGSSHLEMGADSEDAEFGPEQAYRSASSS